MKREIRISFSSLVKYGLQGVAFGLVAMTAVIFFTLEPGALQLLRHFPLFFFPVFLCMVVIAWMCHGARIWALSNALGHKLKYLRCLSIALSVEFGVAASPAGVGGAAVRVAFLKQSGIPYTRAASMLAADVMLDVLYFCVLIMATFAVVIADPVWRGIFAGMHTTAPGRVGIITLVCALTACLVFVLSARSARSIERFLGKSRTASKLRVPARLRLGRARLGLGIKRTIRMTKFLFQRRRSALLGSFLFALLQWSCRYGILPLTVLAFAPDKNPFPLMAVQGLLFTFGLLIVVPGGGGGVELLSVLILGSFIPASLTGIVVLIWRFFTYHLYLLVGGVVFFFMCGRKGDKVIQQPARVL